MQLFPNKSFYINVQINTKGNINMTIQKTGNMKPEQRLQIREGMTVADVKKYGSKGQQLAASLFDFDGPHNEDSYNKDGVFTKQEAERFNNFNFSVKDNAFTMYDRKQDQAIEFKYNNPEDLYRVLNAKYNCPGSFWCFNEAGERIAHLKESTEGGKITIDLSKGTTTVDGVDGEYVVGKGNKMTVKNSDLENINTNSKELEIQNTKDKGVIWDSSTKVTIGNDTNINVDTESDITIERDNK